MRNVLVTGGTRGLGLAVTERLANHGYHVIATGRSLSSELESLASRQLPGGRISFAELDLSAPENLHELVRDLITTHGQLYGLVNNAALGHDGVLATMHDSQIEELVRVNLVATILLTKYVCRSMLIQREGRIVNVASIVAKTGFNGLSVYAATKAGLIGFTKSLARELGKAGITVNSVSPGFMATGMTAAIDSSVLEKIQQRSPLGKLATVHEVAEVVGFLLGEHAGAITGEDITVDAGSTA